jgi:predicted DNA-binding WGR domain protein
VKRIYLEHRDPSRNMERFYAIHITQTMFGEWAVVREWGRIGSPGRIREDWFETRELAARAAEKIVQQKQRKGYAHPSGHPPCPSSFLQGQ